MKNWINRYVLSIGILLVVLFTQAAGHSNSVQTSQAGKETYTSTDVQKGLTSINSISSPVFKKAENRFTTSEVDEEEVTASAKKFLKGTACIPTSFTGHQVSGHFDSVYQKCLYTHKPLTSFWPYRLYIKFRVIRL